MSRQFDLVNRYYGFNPLEGADDIKKIEVIRNHTSQAIIFTWEEPPDPNGVILTYHIDIQESVSISFLSTNRNCKINYCRLKYYPEFA